MKRLLEVLAIISLTTAMIFVEEPEVEPIVTEEVVCSNDVRTSYESVIETQVLERSFQATDSEIDLIALVTMAEAEGESEYGKRLVIDTILNRVDSEHFPDNVYDVIYQPGQFSSMYNGRSDRCYVKDDIRQLVLEEFKNRNNRDVIFFGSNGYSSYGERLFREGNHYFSSY